MYRPTAFRSIYQILLQLFLLRDLLPMLVLSSIFCGLSLKAYFLNPTDLNQVKLVWDILVGTFLC